jgi:hypothetical protein
MESYSDVEEFRATQEAVTFADGWLEAQRTDDVTSDFHMNLLAWTAADPFHVLGIVMNLIDRVGDDDATAEMVALGPVEWLCEHCSDDFIPVLSEAVDRHPGLSLYTKWNRENSEHPAWRRLRKK